MTESDDTKDQTNDAPHQTTNDARRALLPLRAGAHGLAVYANETDGFVEFKARAAALPFAPPAVVGVVAVRGRMRTVIDPRPLLQRPAGESTTETEADERPPYLVLLKGDEQLALAVAHVGETIEISDRDIRPPDPAHNFAHGSVEHEGSPLIILAPSKLFDAATRGMERRRRRR